MSSVLSLMMKETGKVNREGVWYHKTVNVLFKDFKLAIECNRFCSRSEDKKS